MVPHDHWHGRHVSCPQGFCAEITVKERNQFSVFCERGWCDAGLLVQPLKGLGDTGSVAGRTCSLACQSMVCTRTSKRITGTFSDAQGIYRCTQTQICNIICECVESVVRQQKSIERYPCVNLSWP